MRMFGTHTRKCIACAALFGAFVPPLVWSCVTGQETTPLWLLRLIFGS